MLAWGDRAGALEGVARAAALGEEEEEARLGRGDDMLMHAKAVAAAVTCGESASSLFESVVMPLNTTGDRPMIIAPVLIRSTAPPDAERGARAPAARGGARHPEAAAVVVEAGTAGVHLLSLDEPSAGGSPTPRGEAGGSAPAVELRLEPLNHAPLSLPAPSPDPHTWKAAGSIGWL